MTRTLAEPGTYSVQFNAQINIPKANYTTGFSTATAAEDLNLIYTDIMAIPVTATHALTFGNGEILFPGVYNVAGAASIAGTLTLNGNNEINPIFIKIKGLLGMKADLHRKFIASLIGGVQVGTGGNLEDVVYNERDFSIRISTRFNDKWGRVDIGNWSMREDDPKKFLSDPEIKRLEDGSPEEKDVLRKRICLEALAESFKEGVDALIEAAQSVEDFDAYLERFAGMAQQPVVMH